MNIDYKTAGFILFLSIALSGYEGAGQQVLVITRGDSRRSQVTENMGSGLELPRLKSWPQLSERQFLTGR